MSPREKKAGDAALDAIATRRDTMDLLVEVEADGRVTMRDWPENES